MPRVKRLVRHGNSQAVILDRSLMDVVGIEPNSMVSIEVRKNKLIIGAANVSDARSRSTLLRESLDKGNERYGRALQRLAQDPSEPKGE